MIPIAHTSKAWKQWVLRNCYMYMWTKLLLHKNKTVFCFLGSSYPAAESLILISQSFRGHEGWSSCTVWQESIMTLKLITDTKICYLYVAIIPQQQIRGFDVSVNDFLIVYYKTQNKRISSILYLFKTYALKCSCIRWLTVFNSQNYVSKVETGHILRQWSFCWDLHYWTGNG